MLHCRTLHNRINDIHERALRLTFKDNQSSFKQLLEKDHYHRSKIPMISYIVFLNNLEIDKDVTIL